MPPSWRLRIKTNKSETSFVISWSDNHWRSMLFKQSSQFEFFEMATRQKVASSLSIPLSISLSQELFLERKREKQLFDVLPSRKNQTGKTSWIASRFTSKVLLSVVWILIMTFFVDSVFFIPECLWYHNLFEIESKFRCYRKFWGYFRSISKLRKFVTRVWYVHSIVNVMHGWMLILIVWPRIERKKIKNYRACHLRIKI